MEKTCSACGETKPRAEFWRKTQGRDGLQAACKKCTEERHRLGLLRPPRYATPPGTKRCAACKETKPEEDFPRNSRYFDGRHISCKACSNARHKVYRTSERGAAKIATSRRAKSAEPKIKDEYYDQRMRRKFGLPEGWTYKGMLAAQDGGCAICGTDTNYGMFRFGIDHCGRTGVVRGLLCTTCNQGLGQFQDRPELLRKAASYLENPPGPQI